MINSSFPYKNFAIYVLLTRKAANLTEWMKFLFRNSGRKTGCSGLFFVIRGNSGNVIPSINYAPFGVWAGSGPSMGKKVVGIVKLGRKACNKVLASPEIRAGAGQLALRFDPKEIRRRCPALETGSNCKERDQLQQNSPATDNERITSQKRRSHKEITKNGPYKVVLCWQVRLPMQRRNSDGLTPGVSNFRAFVMSVDLTRLIYVPDEQPDKTFGSSIPNSAIPPLRPFENNIRHSIRPQNPSTIRLFFVRVYPRMGWFVYGKNHTEIFMSLLASIAKVTQTDSYCAHEKFIATLLQFQNRPYASRYTITCAGEAAKNGHYVFCRLDETTREARLTSWAASTGRKLFHAIHNNPFWKLECHVIKALHAMIKPAASKMSRKVFSENIGDLYGLAYRKSNNVNDSGP
ncbi:hypothetical protein TcasGA2_TC008360 [Tribolium castaneum]|uniref:Uncharacterized protein n=1 Tax=Tribolium castaneum TaxID=7070 RepID=D2A1A5_TRICA|nr:hypothetical protein TcasGA2_TC008360 [Tribolium castaneum]